MKGLTATLRVADRTLPIRGCTTWTVWEPHPPCVVIRKVVELPGEVWMTNADCLVNEF